MREEQLSPNGDITGIILAGGKSSRMGKNKALLPIQGVITIERLKRELEKTVSCVIVVANDVNQYSFLEIAIVGDIEKGKGPLGGIHSGLSASHTEWNLISACDMPFVNLTIIEGLKLELKEEYDAIIPKIRGQIHPLFGMYRKSSLPIIRQSLIENRLRIIDILSQWRVRYVTEDEFLGLGLNELELEKAFYNMNYPEDYQRIIQSEM
ncbi:molybdenum cofactor guanylyltransferase [Evansella tamaricis]|uniref:Probable molybdenum cofactor guanylyltransferase n=1 Tax=Evansella tamaricis TaxID=2069301 RepID=A0ABS6JJB7_9BACI|nr:molybdenum cofactor guanylyltransferase [Evansella tamaricis]MBU9713777.1 molybdenum cofactor guanylyltransferase [Evansella tamaricis]